MTTAACMLGHYADLCRVYSASAKGWEVAIQTSVSSPTNSSFPFGDLSDDADTWQIHHHLTEVRTNWKSDNWKVITCTACLLTFGATTVTDLSFKSLGPDSLCEFVAEKNTRAQPRFLDDRKQIKWSFIHKSNAKFLHIFCVCKHLLWPATYIRIQFSEIF